VVQAYLFNNSFKMVTEVDGFSGVLRRQEIAQVFNDHVCVIISLVTSTLYTATTYQWYSINNKVNAEWWQYCHVADKKNYINFNRVSLLLSSWKASKTPFITKRNSFCIPFQY